jgi:signal recognition particle receptor subunit alpha
LLSLSWVDNLVTAAKALFIKEYAQDVSKAHPTNIDTRRFDLAFERVVQRLDTGSTRNVQSDSDAAVELAPPSSSHGDDNEPPPPPIPAPQFKTPAIPLKAQQPVDDTTSADTTPVPTPDTSRPATPSQPPASHLLTAKAGPGKASRRARKAQHRQVTSAPASSGDEASGRKGKGGKGSVKAKRRWDADGLAVDGDDDAVLDYSATADDNAEGSDTRDLNIDDVSASQMGSRTGKGQFVLKDLDDEVDAILASQKNQTAASTAGDNEAGGLLNSATSRISGLFRNVVGGKTLTKADLQQPLQAMRNHLLEKNAAREAAERLCSSVEADLLDHKTASFTSIDKTIRESMSKALTRILTPTSPLDLIRDVQTTITPPNARPYVISIVGVNGVGKSTNLSKIAYFLLQNQFRVLVVAADTFRSGAVEQLRVHVRNLSELSRRENVGHIELFEKGYGKDAAAVARDAVSYATNTGKGDMLFDVVLIDTAGRRHNDTRLMSSLTKFGQLANPDKIFMVGEALVGTDSVAQARNFAKEFVDSKVCSLSLLFNHAQSLIVNTGPTKEQRRRHGWLHHQQMRHCRRHGGHFGFHGARHRYSCGLSGCRTALRRPQGPECGMGCR